MLSTWPPMLRRARPSPKVLAEVALGVVLVAALGLTPRDAVPAESTDSLLGPNVHFTASVGPEPSFAMMLSGVSNLASLAAAGGTMVAASAVAKAQVPTSPPAELLIPLLEVHRAIEPVGVNRSGVMNLPANAWNAGWLKGGPIPGAPGDAVIEGHAGFPNQPMIFGRLSTLKRGAQVVVVLSDNTRRLFTITSSASLPVGKAPPDLASPYGPPRLTLITCSGDFDEATHSYSRRLVVEASYSGLV